jgi:Ca-activated chloride channel homolog
MASRWDEPEVTIHRRSRRVRRLRRLAVGFVLIGAAALAVAVLPGVIGLRLAAGAPGGDCARSRAATVIAVSPAYANVMGNLADRWNANRPAGTSPCARISVVPKEPSQVATALGAGWETVRDGPYPDVWLPDSSLWLSAVESRPEIARMLPRQRPGIASSPVVLAVRQPLAQALGWPGRPLDSTSLFAALSRTAATQQPVRLGMTDPGVSTAGLASVLTLLDPAATGTVSDAQLLNGVRFSNMVGAVAPDTSTFFDAPPGPPVPGQPQIVAWPAVERDVALHNNAHPDALLVPVYPPNPVVADYPYVVLTAPWVDAKQRTVAEAFRQFLLSPPAQDLLAAQGLRGPDGTVRDSSRLPADQGFQARFGTPRPPVDPAVFSQVVSQWSAMQRPANILVALDTSGSMNRPVPGTAMTKLQLLQQTSMAGFSMLTNESSIGLWDFSVSNLRPGQHRELVPFGSIDGRVGPVSRRQALQAAAASLSAVGFTPLYDTAYAAFHEMQNHWRANCTNVVLLVTDGANEMRGGLSLADLVTRLTREQHPDRPVQIIAVAVGSEADAASLQTLSEATGGRAFLARDPANAVQSLILAFAGRPVWH